MYLLRTLMQHAVQLRSKFIPPCHDIWNDISRCDMDEPSIIMSSREEGSGGTSG